MHSAPFERPRPKPTPRLTPKARAKPTAIWKAMIRYVRWALDICEGAGGGAGLQNEEASGVAAGFCIASQPSKMLI